MNIPIENENALDTRRFEGVGRRDSGIVEETESHCAVALGVVARGPRSHENRGMGFS
jgi:hypothetical protein